MAAVSSQASAGVVQQPHQAAPPPTPPAAPPAAAAAAVVTLASGIVPVVPPPAASSSSIGPGGALTAAGLDAAITEIKNAIQATSSRPGFSQIRGSLFGGSIPTTEEEVQMLEGASVSEQELSHLKEAITHIKRLVLKTSTQFKLPYQEILKRAAEKHKLEQARVLACNQQIKNLLAAPPPPVPPAGVSVSVVSVAPPAAPTATPTSSVSAPVLPTVPVPPETVQQQVQVSPVPRAAPGPATGSNSGGGSHSADEARMLRYGKAILKLKHYRRALKYAMWDFQDGKSMEEAAAQHKITIDVLKYSVDLILQKTGETLEQFRQNKALNLEEHPGPKSEEYVGRLRRAVNFFKQKAGSSLYEFANTNQISLFDLTDELIKELEIENKISSLKPVAPEPPAPPPPPPPPAPVVVGVPATSPSLPPPTPPSPAAILASAGQPTVVTVSLPTTPLPMKPSAAAAAAASTAPVTVSLSVSLPTQPLPPSAVGASQPPSCPPPLPALPSTASLTVSPAVGASASASASPVVVSSVSPTVASSGASTSAAVAPAVAVASCSSSSSVFSDICESEATTILSDIDDVIREDTLSGTAASAVSVDPLAGQASLPNVTISTCPETGDLIANNNNDNDVQAVITVNICNVCKKLFLDPKGFQEHENEGCIDF